MKFETGDNVHKTEKKEKEIVHREFVSLQVNNNFQPDLPMEVTLHNCIIDGENALRYKHEDNPKFKDKMFIFMDVFDDDGTIEKIILKESWGKVDAFAKRAGGSPAGTELRKMLLVDPNEIEHPKIKPEFQYTPFWIKKFVVQGVGSQYHMIHVGFEEDVEIPDNWQPFIAKKDELYWGDIKDEFEQYKADKLAEYEKHKNENEGSDGAHEEGSGCDNVSNESSSMGDEELAAITADSMVADGVAVTKIASTLADSFNISTGDGMKLAALAYKKAESGK